MNRIHQEYAHVNAGQYISTVKVMNSTPDSLTSVYFRSFVIGIAMFMLLLAFTPSSNAGDLALSDNPYIQFNPQGELVQPSGYREWVYLDASNTEMI